jgi:hypothetical protein
MSIDRAIADAVTRSTVALTQEEEAALSRQVSHRVAQLDAEEILRELIDDLGRQRVQQTLDALS